MPPKDRKAGDRATITLRLPENIRAELEIEAERSGVSMNALITQQLERAARANKALSAMERVTGMLARHQDTMLKVFDSHAAQIKQLNIVEQKLFNVIDICTETIHDYEQDMSRRNISFTPVADRIRGQLDMLKILAETVHAHYLEEERAARNEMQVKEGEAADD